MENILTRDELESYLYIIRKTLCGYDYKKISNVIFFNNEAVYEYLCDIPLYGRQGTVGDALEAVRAFIPVNLGGNSLNLLLEADSTEQFNTVEAEFLKTNQMEFLQFIAQISTSAEWICLINLCETIRLFKEKEELAVLR